MRGGFLPNESSYSTTQPCSTKCPNFSENKLRACLKDVDTQKSSRSVSCLYRLLSYGVLPTLHAGEFPYLVQLTLTSHSVTSSTLVPEAFFSDFAPSCTEYRIIIRTTREVCSKKTATKYSYLWLACDCFGGICFRSSFHTYQAEKVCIIFLTTSLFPLET